MVQDTQSSVESKEEYIHEIPYDEKITYRMTVLKAKQGDVRIDIRQMYDKKFTKKGIRITREVLEEISEAIPHLVR